MLKLPDNLPAIATARLPGAYEAAKAALANCEAVDECKDWADKAAALASYARQVGDDELLKRSMRIQARALRRAGELLADKAIATNFWTAPSRSWGSPQQPKKPASPNASEKPR